MLERPGDLIPVKPAAATIPWTRRRSQILNFLHRGPVNFSTLVYDTNVGDISSLASYFNEERISVDDLNSRFGHNPFGGESGLLDETTKIGNENVVMPRLLLYPERVGQGEASNLQAGSDPLQTQVSVQRTLDWVMSQKLKARAKASVMEEPGEARAGAREGHGYRAGEGRPEGLAGLLQLNSCDLLEGAQFGPRTVGSSKRWSGGPAVLAGAPAVQGSATEPADLAAALDVVSRALCDRSWAGNGREVSPSW